MDNMEWQSVTTKATEMLEADREINSIPSDVVNLVNIILVVNQNPSDCEFSDADYNNDSIVNIQDVILVITNILN